MGDKDSDSGTSLQAAIAEAAKVTALEIYNDVAKPAAVQIGRTLGLAAGTTLMPVNFVLTKVQNAYERLMSRVEDKASLKPSRRLIQPPINIAAPVALQYSLLGDGDDTAALRDMFENLLLSSMEEEYARSVHPSFASIISQLTQDEAWILKSIDCTTYDYIQGNDRRSFCTMLGVNTGIDESKIEFYINNLVRLGILEMHTGFAGVLEHAPSALAERFARSFPNVPPELASRLSMHVTSFGIQFLATCTRVTLTTR